MLALDLSNTEVLLNQSGGALPQHFWPEENINKLDIHSGQQHCTIDQT